MKKIIALRGRANVGKTTTIKQFYHECMGSKYETIQHVEGGEIFAIVIIDEIKVGITSTGDTHDDVKNVLNCLRRKSCQVCISACRTRGQTNWAIEKAADDVTYIEKQVCEGPKKQSNANASDVKILFEELLVTIKNLS